MTTASGDPDHGKGARVRRAGAWLPATLFAAVLLSAFACRERPAPRIVEVLVPFLPESLDPYSDPRLVSRSIYSAVYEPLVAEHESGFRPALAESWTNPAPDTWLFRIAEGAAFHDRSPVTSREVVRAAHASRTARGSVASLADLRAIEVADERTVRFRTFRAPEDFLLSVSALFVARKEGESFVGSGPYRIVTRTPDRIVLTRNDRPHRAAPYLDEVVFRRFTSAAEGLRLMERDVPIAVADPAPAMVAAAKGDPRFRVVTTDTGGLTYLAIGFSAGAGPLSDVRVRRALRLALDLPALVAAGTVAGGSPAGRVVPPGSFGHDPQRRPPPRDLAAARRLLAEAGHPDGFEVELDVGPNARRAGQALAAQAAGAGIRLRVVVRRPADFAARIEGGSPLYLYSWFVGRDAGQALRNAFHTRDASRGLGSMNRTGFSSAAVDAAFARLASAARAEERLARLREISDLLDEGLPWIPLYSARESRILPVGLDLGWRPDGLLVIADARPAGGGR